MKIDWVAQFAFDGDVPTAKSSFSLDTESRDSLDRSLKTSKNYVAVPSRTPGPQKPAIPNKNLLDLKYHSRNI